MKNNLTDLNDHLFMQLERLNDEGLSNENLQKEIDRSKAITKVSESIVSNATLQLEAVKLKAEHIGLKEIDLPKLSVFEQKQ